MRPGSRGINQDGFVPGTARIGTAGSGRLATARPMSGRMGGQVPSTPSREAAYGVALSQEVRISDRPVTQQGMSGMKTAGGGRGRLVQDASYFIGALRTKINDIQKELRRLQDQIGRHNVDSSQLGQLERRYETLLQEVKGMEGTLADYNLSMDKVRTSADAGDVLAFLAELEDRNRRTAAELDGVFLAKQQRERNMADIEAETERLHRELAEKINALEPHKMRQYQDLLGRRQELQAAVAGRQVDVDALAAAVREHEAHLPPDGGAREAYAEAERQVGRLRRRAAELQADLEVVQMEPKRAREALLARVKSDQDAFRDLERILAETREEVSRMRRQVADADADGDGGGRNSGGSGSSAAAVVAAAAGGIDPSKVEVLQKREQEMAGFLAGFESARTESQAEQRHSQESIVALLERISIGLDAQQNLPDADRMKELQDESSFKEKQLRSSETTMKRLQQEREKRQQELERINSLDQKIPPEIQALKDRITQMKEEMVAFEDMAGLRRKAEETKAHLLELRGWYLKRQDAMKGQVQQLSGAHESAKKELAASETAKALDAFEQKLRSHETSIFQLREYVETKGREIDFDAMRNDCKDMVSQLNDLIIKSDLSESFAKPY